MSWVPCALWRSSEAEDEPSQVTQADMEGAKLRRMGNMDHRASQGGGSTRGAHRRDTDGGEEIDAHIRRQSGIVTQRARWTEEPEGPDSLTQHPQ